MRRTAQPRSRPVRGRCIEGGWWARSPIDDVGLYEPARQVLNRDRRPAGSLVDAPQHTPRSRCPRARWSATGPGVARKRGRSTTSASRSDDSSQVGTSDGRASTLTPSLTLTSAKRHVDVAPTVDLDLVTLGRDSQRKTGASTVASTSYVAVNRNVFSQRSRRRGCRDRRGLVTNRQRSRSTSSPSPGVTPAWCRPSPARGPRARGRPPRACRGCGSRRRPGRSPPSPPRAW
jgi:hypothetical protein